MTHPSKITKAELLERLAKMEAALALAEEERDLAAEKLRTLIVPTPARVPEAEALAGCIRALDALPTIRSRNSYSGDDGQPDRKTSRRILVALADRYGIELIERATEPCSRAHLDEMPSVSIRDAVGAVMGR